MIEYLRRRKEEKQMLQERSPAVQASGLSKHFGSKKAVEGLDLVVYEKEIFGLLGPNGAGKTTTIKMLATLFAPTAGRATVSGIDLHRNPVGVRRVIGYIPQERALDRYLTGREHLLLQADLYHLPSGEARQRSEDVLTLLDLHEAADQLVGTYSGGMKKKIEIACGLIHQPRVLLMDEPTLGLDVQIRARIWGHIRDLRSRGMTILLTTNYLDEADSLCDRLAMIDEGRICVIGSPDELKKNLKRDILSIRLSAPGELDYEKASATLKSLPFITEVFVTDGVLTIPLQPGEGMLFPILQALSTARLSVESVYFQRPTLEDVFLSYAGHKIKEERR